MAQNQWVDITDDEDQWVDEPINEVHIPSVIPPVAPVNTGPTQDELLRDARRFLPPESPQQSSLQTQTLDNLETESPPEPSFLDRLVSPLTTLPSKLANKVAEPMMAFGEKDDSVLNKMALYGGAFAQSLGDVASAMTSPADLAAAALTGGAGFAAKRGLALAPKLADAARVASAAPTVHGLGEVVASDNTMGERAIGAIEALGGGLGMRGIPGVTSLKMGSKAVDNVPVPKPTPAELNILSTPDEVLPEFPTAIVTNNQAVPTARLRKEQIVDTIGGAEVVDNAGQTVRSIKTGVPLMKTQSRINLAPIEESIATGKPVTQRISPNETLDMLDPPQLTGIPEADAITWKDYLSVPRAIQSAYDLSMPFRQGLGLIHTAGWWKAWPSMMKAVGSENAYKAVMESIDQRPNYIKGASGKSFAEEAGLQLTSLGNLAKRDEEIGSKIAESIPILGKGIRISNRAANAFMNKLRADNFDSLINSAEAAGLDPRKNLVLSQQIARFVNTASGRGNFTNPKNEQFLVALNQALFSPRLMASRVQMLNPKNYVMGNPFVRKQYLKSAIALGTAWGSFAGLGKLGGADVSTDTESSDFGQIKVGNTRIDPSGGFRPYIVLASRLNDIAEKQANSRYSGKYGARTAEKDITDFVETKLAPMASYAWGPWGSDDKFPHYVGDETVKLFTPIMVQDIIELAKEDPKLLGVAIPAAAVGMGTNSYPEGKEEEPRMTEPIWPKKYDLRFPRQ